jgi:hypothetical protein
MTPTVNISVQSSEDRDRSLRLQCDRVPVYGPSRGEVVNDLLCNGWRVVDTTEFGHVILVNPAETVYITVNDSPEVTANA